MQYPPYMLYIMFLIYSILIVMISIYFAKVNCGLSTLVFIKDVIVRCLVVFFTTLLFAYLPVYFMESGIFQLSLVISISTLLLGIMIWTVGLNNQEKAVVKKMRDSVIVKVSFFKMIK